MTSSTCKKSGFTIIEVVLVLAIAGLIFLMVFLALPALQSNQRDTQRKNDAAMLATAVREYMKYNRGKTPPDSGSVVSEPQWGAGDERNDVGLEWSNPNTSHVLDRYIGSDITQGGVTDGYTISNYTTQPNVNRAYWTISGSQSGYRNGISGTVVIFVGGKCPDMTKVTRTYFELEVTHLGSDIAIFRMLENGYWYCKNM